MPDPNEFSQLLLTGAATEANHSLRKGEFDAYVATVVTALSNIAAALSGKLGVNATAADVNVAGAAIAAALLGKLGVNATAADVNVAGAAIAAALGAKLGTGAQAADVNVAGTAIAAALLAKLNASALDTDGTMAADSDLKVASQKATRTYIASTLAGVAKNRGALDCSANPNYPAAVNGDFYRCSVAGKIGGGAGVVVEVADLILCVADNAGGTQGAVGASWIVGQANIAGITAAGLAMLQAADAAAQAALLSAFFLAAGAAAADVNPAGSAIGAALAGKQASLTPASQEEMEAGTQAAIRSMSPLLVAQAIAALASGGGSALIRASGVLQGNTVAAQDEVVANPASSSFNSYAAVPYGATARGAWAAETEDYAIGDFVANGGSLWLATGTPTTALAPGDDLGNWTNYDSSIQLRITFDGVTAGWITISTSATGDIALALLGTESGATINSALAAALAAYFAADGLIVTSFEGGTVYLSTPHTGADQLIDWQSSAGPTAFSDPASKFFQSPGSSYGNAYVAAAGPSGAINEVELVPAVEGKKVKMVSACLTGNLPAGLVFLAVKSGDTYTTVGNLLAADGGGLKLFLPDDNSGGSMPSLWLGGLNAGESLVALRNNTTGMQSGTTCRVEIIAEQSA